MDIENKEPTNYVEVGHLVGLRGRNLLRFVEYMKIRWSDTEESKCYYGYAFEWAERFDKGVEYESSDLEGKSILINIDQAWIEKIKDHYKVG